MSDDKIIELNIDDPVDAKRFILEAIPECFPEKQGISYVILQSGRKLEIKDMTDSELCQYARELLPIYKAAFPEKVNMVYEQ